MERMVRGRRVELCEYMADIAVYGSSASYLACVEECIV